MSPLFKKKKPASLEKRLQKVQEEMEQVDHDLRLLSKFVEKPNRPVDFSRLKAATIEKPVATPSAVPRRGSGPVGKGPFAPPSRPVSATPPLSAGPAPVSRPEAVAEPRPDARACSGKANAYDERFADYLASSFQASRPLRQERAIQRNKAIVMLIFVIALLILAFYRFFKL